MVKSATGLTRFRDEKIPVLPTSGLPILYEDEEEGDMGEANSHVDSDEIAHIGMKAHLVDWPELQVYSNMNLYYADEPLHRSTGSQPYVSPDVMVVKAFRLLPLEVKSYKIGADGPAPLSVTEVLSQRSAQQRDLAEKIVIYAGLRVPEYLLVDITGKYLKQKLLLKRLQADGTYQDKRDADGGITSDLGFRLLIDVDGRLRVVNGRTGIPYARPDEAEREAAARRLAEERIRELEAELARLKNQSSSAKKRKKS